MWQLLALLRFLHDIYHCMYCLYFIISTLLFTVFICILCCSFFIIGCHLDLVPENILLEGVEFVEQKDGSIAVSSDILLKLCDFGVGEIFNTLPPRRYDDSFKCCKDGLNVNNAAYSAPNLHSDGVFDARAADMWSVGMIFYHCLVGKPLFTAADKWPQPKHGYKALLNG